MRFESLSSRLVRFGLAGLLAVVTANESMSAETGRLVEGNTAFAIDFYGQLKTAPGNVFFSPFSISTCLGMAYAGARGDTEKQMARVLHFAAQQSQFHAAFNELQRGLNNDAAQTQIQLNIANALWTQQGHPFLPDFLKLTSQNYQASIRQVDFTTAAESARAEINQWVEQQTHNRIIDILPPDGLSNLSRLVLVNAIYFKGSWARQFLAAETSKMPFFLSSTKKSEVPMMHHFDQVNYAATTNFQAVELPYRGNALSMLIFLPRHVAGCSQLENWLTPIFIQQWLSRMKMQEVEIFLPKFKMEFTSELRGTLERMGMTDAFASGPPLAGPSADFSGIDGTKSLSISKVFHKAWVEVSEEGTEAAAATATALAEPVGIGQEPPRPPVFRADHPFLFFIRDRRSGSLLFLGRLADPNT